jgi:hypothetical protein
MCLRRNSLGKKRRAKNVMIKEENWSDTKNITSGGITRAKATDSGHHAFVVLGFSKNQSGNT